MLHYCPSACGAGVHASSGSPDPQANLAVEIDASLVLFTSWPSAGLEVALWREAMSRFPAPSTGAPLGRYSEALLAGPPSPESEPCAPIAPIPATVVMMRASLSDVTVYAGSAGFQPLIHELSPPSFVFRFLTDGQTKSKR